MSLLPLAALVLISTAQAKTLTGTELATHSKQKVFSQETLTYSAQLKAHKLAAEPDLEQNIFIAHTLSCDTARVSGSEYVYDTATRELKFLSHPMHSEAKGGGTDLGCKIPDGEELSIFYWSAAKLAELRRKYGAQVSTEALAFIDANKPGSCACVEESNDLVVACEPATQRFAQPVDQQAARKYLCTPSSAPGKQSAPARARSTTAPAK